MMKTEDMKYDEFKNMVKDIFRDIIKQPIKEAIIEAIRELPKEVVTESIRKSAKETATSSIKESVKIPEDESLNKTCSLDQKATLTIEECAEYSGIGRAKIRELVHSSKANFPSFKVGTKVLINRKLFIEWLDKASIERKTL